MYKLFIGCCIVIYALCSSMAAFAQLFSFQPPTNQTNTLSSSPPTRTALSPDQFRQEVRSKGDTNRKALEDLAKKNQKPLPADMTFNAPMGGTSKNPIPNKTPPPPQTARTPTTTTNPPPTPGTLPSKPETPQNPYYTGTQFQSGTGTGTNTQGGTGKQWNINY